MKKLFYVLVFLVLVSGPSIALSEADTPESRARAVEQYFNEFSMRKMMDGMTKEMLRQVPPEQQKSFVETMTKHLRVDVVEAAAKQSLAKHLTLNEINVLVEFIKRPEGKSAMEKMKYYMADLMPIIQQEVMRAMLQFKQSVDTPKAD